MATDWPGHAQNNTHPHVPTCCDCDQYFSAAQEPPWLYVFPALPTQDMAQKDFLETGRYLPARFGNQICIWRWTNADEISPAFKTIFARIEPIPGGGGWHNVLHVAYSEIAIFWEYKLLPDTSFGVGTRIVRGFVWTYNSFSWEKVIDTPVPDWGPPIGVPILTPRDCVPNWNYGDPIPNA